MTWQDRLRAAGWHDEGKGYWFQQPPEAGLGIGVADDGFWLTTRDGADRWEGRFDYIVGTIGPIRGDEPWDQAFDRWLAMPFGKTTIGVVVGVQP